MKILACEHKCIRCKQDGCKLNKPFNVIVVNFDINNDCNITYDIADEKSIIEIMKYALIPKYLIDKNRKYIKNDKAGKVRRIDLQNGFLIYFKRMGRGISSNNNIIIENSFNKWINSTLLNGQYNIDNIISIGTKYCRDEEAYKNLVDDLISYRINFYKALKSSKTIRL